MYLSDLAHGVGGGGEWELHGVEVNGSGESSQDQPSAQTTNIMGVFWSPSCSHIPRGENLSRGKCKMRKFNVGTSEFPRLLVPGLLSYPYTTLPHLPQKPKAFMRHWYSKAPHCLVQMTPWDELTSVILQPTHMPNQNLRALQPYVQRDQFKLGQMNQAHKKSEDTYCFMNFLKHFLEII